MISILEISQLMIALATACIAYFAFRAIKESIGSTNRSIEDQKATLRANIQIECLRVYLKIQKDKRLAESQNDPYLCYNYYRALFDLHWTEFNLWIDGQISDQIMRAWLGVRNRNYNSSGFNIALPNGENVTYRYVWEDLIHENYFSPEDHFVRFMGMVHDNQIDEAMSELNA